MKKKFVAFINRRYVHSFGMPTCGAETLPEVDFDYCDPEVKQSEIQRIFLRRTNSADFNDWTQPDEWTTRISETDAGANAIRALTVIGDKPLPNAPKKLISSGRYVIPRKEHTVNFTIDEVSDANHDFMQAVENNKRYKMNYETMGGFMFGGNQSIECEVNIEMVLARGAGEIMVYQGTLVWVSPNTEERCQSPIFAETVLGSSALDTTIDFTGSGTPAHGATSFILVGGANAVAKFRYNDINPTIGGALVMTVKVGGVLKLTVTTTDDFATLPFSFTDIGGVTHTGFFAAGDVLF